MCVFATISFLDPLALTMSIFKLTLALLKFNDCILHTDKNLSTDT